MTTTANLTAAMNAAMTEIGSVEMTGVNNEQRYKYASDEDLLRAVQPAMARNGLALVPVAMVAEHHDIGETKTGAPKVRTDLAITYRLLHVSGEAIDIVGYGQGWDFGDKGGYKAQTGALKYVLRTMFAIPVGADPEQPSGRQERAERAVPPQRSDRAPASSATKTAAAPSTSAETWKAMITKVSTARAALQTLLAIWRGEPDVRTRDAALYECASRLVEVTTTGSQLSDAIEWAQAAEKLQLPAAAMKLLRLTLDERIERETARGELEAVGAEPIDTE